MVVKSSFYLLFPLFFSLPSFLIAYSSKVRAEKLFRAGKYADAAPLFRQYLDSGKAVDDFADILIKASIAEQDVFKGLTVLLFYDRKIPNADQRRRVFQRIGLMQEYLGNDSAASAAYHVVFQNSRNSPDYQAYLRSGFLSLESGNVDYALEVAQQLLRDISGGDFWDLAFVLAISAYALKNDFSAGLSLIEQEGFFTKKFSGPSYYYNLFRFYRACHSQDQADEMRIFIVTQYPQSPEAMLIRGEIRSWISPLNVFF